MDESRRTRLKTEIKRKCFHFLSALYAAGYLALGREKALMLLSALLALEAAIEFGRFLRPEWNQKLLSGFGGIHREEESLRASGIFWTLLGSVLTLALFDQRPVILAAMGYLVFGDAAAAFVGVWLSKDPLKKKSWEGTGACFAACFVAGAFVLPLNLAFAGAVFAAAVERQPLPYNDNLWVPVLSGAFLTALL